MTVRQILVIDPAMKTAETEAYNAISLNSPLKTTYHLPAIYGLQSLKAIDMSTVRGIIIFGSAASVHDRQPWQPLLEEWLLPHLMNRIPTLGICYGHQMLAYMFGGDVAYVFPDQVKHCGMRDIEISDLPWFKASKGSVAVSHNEMVTRVPEQFQIMARSPECATDGLMHRDLPIWSFQSHPEATKEFLLQHAIDDREHEKTLIFGRNLVEKFLHFTSSKH